VGDKLNQKQLKYDCIEIVTVDGDCVYSIVMQKAKETRCLDSPVLSTLCGGMEAVIQMTVDAKADHCLKHRDLLLKGLVVNGRIERKNDIHTAGGAVHT